MRLRKVGRALSTASRSEPSLPGDFKKVLRVVRQDLILEIQKHTLVPGLVNQRLLLAALSERSTLSSISYLAGVGRCTLY